MLLLVLVYVLMGVLWWRMRERGKGHLEKEEGGGRCGGSKVVARKWFESGLCWRTGMIRDGGQGGLGQGMMV